MSAKNDHVRFDLSDTLFTVYSHFLASLSVNIFFFGCRTTIPFKSGVRTKPTVYRLWNSSHGKENKWYLFNVSIVSPTHQLKEMESKLRLLLNCLSDVSFKKKTSVILVSPVAFHKPFQQSNIFNFNSQMLPTPNNLIWQQHSFYSSILLLYVKNWCSISQKSEAISSKIATLEQYNFPLGYYK